MADLESSGTTDVLEVKADRLLAVRESAKAIEADIARLNERLLLIEAGDSDAGRAKQTERGDVVSGAASGAAVGAVAGFILFPGIGGLLGSLAGAALGGALAQRQRADFGANAPSAIGSLGEESS